VEIFTETAAGLEGKLAGRLYFWYFATLFVWQEGSAKRAMLVSKSKVDFIDFIVRIKGEV
jgi:hypothetical protein